MRWIIALALAILALAALNRPGAEIWSRWQEPDDGFGLFV